MKSGEFVRRAKRYAKRVGLVAYFNPSRGKGSHGRLHIGDRLTTVPRKEIGPGLLAAMLNDLNIDKKEF